MVAVRLIRDQDGQSAGVRSTIARARLITDVHLQYYRENYRALNQVAFGSHLRNFTAGA